MNSTRSAWPAFISACRTTVSSADGSATSLVQRPRRRQLGLCQRRGGTARGTPPTGIVETQNSRSEGGWVSSLLVERRAQSVLKAASTMWNADDRVDAQNRRQ